MLDAFLEILHAPFWIVGVFLLSLLVLLVDGYLLPLSERIRKKVPQMPSMSRSEIDQCLLKIYWCRASSNFYWIMSLVVITALKGFILSDPTVRISLNIITAILLVTAVEKFRRALKLKRQLSLVIRDV